MKGLHVVFWILVVVGALNWGLEVLGWGMGNYMPAGLATAVYALIGISALAELFTHGKNCKCCEGMCAPKTPNQPM